MDYRSLDVTVISADNLKNVNLMSKMDVYVEVTVSGDPRTLRRTPVHKEGGKSPRWNHRFTLPVSNNQFLVFRIFSARMLGDREIGEVTVPVNELLDSAGRGSDERVIEYQLRTASGKTQGTLKFSYKLGEKMAAPQPPVAAAPHHYTAAPQQFSSNGKASSEPVTAYPPQHAAGYPPPTYGQPYASQSQMGYGYPPPQHGYGYGYPPQQQGYGYPPMAGYGAVPPKKKKQGMGGGLGLGLGAGLLGGLLVGDMISDVGAYDAGYDAGYDDGGGFDGGFDF